MNRFNWENIKTARKIVQLENKFALLEQKIKEIDLDCEELEKNEIIQTYFKLKSSKINLQKELACFIDENDSFINLKPYCIENIEHSLSACNHIWVINENNTYGCIKCGLNTAIKGKSLAKLNYIEKAMYEYLQNNHLSNGIFSQEKCNLDLGMAIYARIIRNYPNLDDETAKKYFEIALNNIQNIPVSESREESRAKRLSLTTNFSKWNL